MIHICTAADEGFAPGLLVMIASLLSSLHKDDTLTLHLMNGGLSTTTINKLRNLCETIHPNCYINNIIIDTTNFEEFDRLSEKTYMYYARLKMGSFIKAEKVIYIDADMLILRDLKKLWDYPMQESPILVCPDYSHRKLADDCPLVLTDRERELPYFNSGLMVINLNYWRANLIEAQSIELAISFKNTYKCKHHDQTVLNYLFRNNAHFICKEWNWQWLNTYNPAKSTNINYHFIFKDEKPWLYFGSNISHLIWRYYYRKYCGNVYSHFLKKGRKKAFISGFKDYLIRKTSLARYAYYRYLKWRGRNTSFDYQTVIDRLDKTEKNMPLREEVIQFKKFKRIH